MSDVSHAQPAWLNVSRETFDQLGAFCQIVKKWNPAINLVSKADSLNLWNRHLLDSAQMFDLIPMTATNLCDLGSGGGFPGVVFAIMAAEMRPQLAITLVESDRRKSVFLSEAVRMLGLKVKVLTERIDELAPQHADVVSARALAPLSALCGFAVRHMAPLGIAIFPKGRTSAQEIIDAKAQFRFQLESRQSLVDAEACILCLKDIHNA